MVAYMASTLAGSLGKASITADGNTAETFDPANIATYKYLEIKPRIGPFVVNYDFASFDYVIGNDGIGGVNGWLDDDNANAVGNTVNVTGGTAGGYSLNYGGTTSTINNTITVKEHQDKHRALRRLYRE